MTRYEPKEIEPKWQEFWLKNKTFKAEAKPGTPKFYCLDMFPYPSGAGLHVGHPEGYTATDIVCRYKRMQGFNVLHPMGWDAFGLPAEQHAIQTGTHPRDTTRTNINTFRRQIRALGFSYDWDREIDTTDPKYFRWTQWIFKQLFESWYDSELQRARPISELPLPAGLGTDEKTIRSYQAKHRLAYLDEVPVWWCQALGTVLANEEVIDGKSERGNHPCERRPLRQWMLKITAYAERLLQDLDSLDWPDSLKAMQRNWIGKSSGAEVKFQVEDLNESLEVFTTRPDTLFGATYMVLAPEHPLLKKVGETCKASVTEYQSQAASRSELERGIDKDKTGVFTGLFAVNPVNNVRIPIWTADYVMMSYGTGAIMAVPAHDERDWAFATKFSIPIIEVISGGSVTESAHGGDGQLVNSGFLNGLTVDVAMEKMIAWLQEKHLGKARIQYKIRDWLFSRQRYWGEPFPIVHGAEGSFSLEDSELPVTLPEMNDYKPTGTFDPPLAKNKQWIQYKNAETLKEGIRECNTMPQWAGSSWYYLRYLDADNNMAPWAKDLERYWMPVDLYIGGAEHAVLHLLYARFWHKVLYDLGHVSGKEPFQKLVNQGLILGEDGEKMSKSRGNVVNPDDVIELYGADAMRLYEMFMGPLERMKPWQMAGIEGQKRFLQRVWRLAAGEEGQGPSVASQSHPDLVRVMHQSIKKVSEDIENLRFNTAISQLMVFSTEMDKADSVSKECYDVLVRLLAPFAPHIAEELWRYLGHKETIAYVQWPQYDSNLIQETNVTVVFQVNGKVRGEKQVEVGTSKDILEKLAREDLGVQKHLGVLNIIKTIVVQNKLVNFVAK